MFTFVSSPLMPVSLLVRGRRGHPIWSSHVETHFIFSPLHCAGTPTSACTATLFDQTLNQQSTTKVRALALLCAHRALHARAPLGSSRPSANIGRQPLSPSPTQSRSTARLPAAASAARQAPLCDGHTTKVWCFDLLTLQWMLATRTSRTVHVAAR
jgi:hypothetical protein